MMRLGEYRSRAAQLADYLPWAALIGEGIILNKDGSLQRTARFRGPDLASATQAELMAVSARLNSALRRLGSSWAVFVEARRVPVSAYPASTFPDPVSALIDAERRARFEGRPEPDAFSQANSGPGSGLAGNRSGAGRHFESRYYLTLVWMPPAGRKAGCSRPPRPAALTLSSIWPGSKAARSDCSTCWMVSCPRRRG